MSHPLQRALEFKVYEGPSLVAPFPAVVAEFVSPYARTYPAEEMRRVFASLVVLRGKPLTFSEDSVDFPELASLLALTFLEAGAPLGLPRVVTRLDKDRRRIAIGYLKSAKAVDALRAGIAMADVVFGHLEGATGDTARLQAILNRARHLAHDTYVGTVTLSFLKAARSLNLPVYELSQGRNVLVYGQGSKAVHQSESLSNRDAATGYRFAQDKFLSNQFVKRLGFPGVEHVLVSSREEARAAAEKLGMPLVVKPLDRNGSVGVTVGIDTMAELDSAVASAAGLSRSNAVLVEKLVPGVEHRLTVHAGKFFRASMIIKAHIFGDGVRPIAEIISSENEKRRAIKSGPDVFVKELTIDEKMVALLAKQGFSPRDVPEAGQKIVLSGTSNLKSGGRREEVTDKVHPDNVAFAEAIAKSFRLDAAGIDYITPDITKPWTDVPGAVIEVNANPGTDEKMAANVFRRRFGEGADGWIPSVLIMGKDFALARSVASLLGEAGMRVGSTSSGETQLAGQRRFVGETALPDRILGLLLDPTCDALVVQMTESDIVSFGLPHTHYGLAVIPPGVQIDEAVRALIANNAGGVLAADGKGAGKIISERLLASRA